MDYLNNLSEQTKLCSDTPMAKEHPSKDFSADLAQRVMAEVQFTGGDRRQSGAAQPGGVTLHHEGAIDSASLPAGWQRSQSEAENSSLRTLSVFHPNCDQSVSISIHDARVPLPPAAAAAFHQLLENHAARSYAPLTDELQAIEPVLRVMNVGDNQYTNPPSANNEFPPSFHMQSCQVQQLNGRAVLAVEGRFGAQGQGSPFRGIFIERGDRVEGIAYEAADLQSYLRHSGAFNGMLRSIKWSG